VEMEPALGKKVQVQEGAWADAKIARMMNPGIKPPETALLRVEARAAEQAALVWGKHEKVCRTQVKEIYNIRSKTNRERNWLMKNIAICASGNKPEDRVDGRFGRCSFFMVWNPDTSEFTSLDNSGIDAAHGAGTGAAQVLLKNQVGVVLTSRIGPKAFQVLKAAGIKIFQGQETVRVEELLQKYLDGQLQELEQPNN